MCYNYFLLLRKIIVEFKIPKPLQDSIKNEKLIIFVGAGLSINEGFPSWKKIVLDLLVDKRDYIKNSEAYEQALNTEILSPLEVLDKLESEKKIILEAFEKYLKVQKTDAQIHQLLGTISSKFITTNFDNLIESNTPINEVITQESEFNLAKIDRVDGFVMKIHGDVNRLDKCIVFTNQYKNLYDEDNLAIFQLKKLISEYSFLFIGFSFNDPYVNELFNYMSSLMDGFGPKHYFISTTDKDLNHINNINIGDYANLKDFVEELTKSKESAETEVQEETVHQVTIDKEEILKELSGTDVAPTVFGWVGRKDELEMLHSESIKAYFITGIGGQGKSALASYYITNKADISYEIVDWRDFKEEEHKFQHKIQSMIRVIAPKYNDCDLAGFTDEELILFFFKNLGNKKCIFVLDNVDSYIDLETLEPIKGIGLLFKSAMEISHNSKFIFTCRPFIHFARINFYQLQLEGLKEEDTIQYFLSGNSNLKRDTLIDFAKKSHKLTKGHALWLSLILAQSKKGEKKLSEFLYKIETGMDIENDDSSILSRQILNSIWRTLQERDKLVLKTLAESIVSETIDDYAEILGHELNYNKFMKAIKTLRSLNLIIEKRNSDYIELNPLVKEFVRTNHPSSERRKFISMIIGFYDKSVLILKNKLSYKLSFDDFSKFTNKAELSINAGEHQDAIHTLWEIIPSMTSAGYTEEYLRVAKLLFNSISWNKKTIESYNYFNNLINRTLRVSIEFGEKEYALELMDKYEDIIENKSDAYIELCGTKSYMYWFKDDYENAISICDEALYLLNRAGQPDKFDIIYNQALAYRDTKNPENIQKALDIFKKDFSIEEILQLDMDRDGNGAMFGNIGKCLYFKGSLEEALICYFKSFYYISKLDIGQRLINLGYATFWIAEVLIDQNKKEEAYYFLKFAHESWSNSSPVLINRNSKVLALLNESTIGKTVNSLEYWRIEKYCNEYISKNLGVKEINF